MKRRRASEPDLVPLESIGNEITVPAVEGQTRAEVVSIAHSAWQKICNMTLRQRRALLLGSSDAVVELLVAGVTDEQLAESLDFSIEEWLRIREKLPLMSIEIAELVSGEKNRNNLEKISNSIKKARYEARVKLRRGKEK